MALGIEQNSIAPQLIQNSGQALVQGIRQIGQQISGALTELQTKRDLGAMAQEIQNLNPQSNEFPVQLTQLVTRHPLAVRDERGQMALSVLGKAHGAWQASQADALAFQRQMQMQGVREDAATRRAEAAEEARRSRPITLPGVGLVQPNEIDEVTGQPKVLLPVPKKESTALPFASSPSGIFDRRSGQVTTPAPPKANSEARMQKKQRIDLLMRLDASARTEFGRLESRRDALSKQRMELDADNPDAVYLDNTIRAIEAEAANLKKQRDDIRKQIEAIEIVPAEDQTIGGEPEPTALIPVGQVPPPVANPNERIPVIGPDGKTGTVSAAQLESALQNGYKRR